MARDDKTIDWSAYLGALTEEPVDSPRRRRRKTHQKSKTFAASKPLVIDEPVAEVIDEPVAEVIDEPVAEVIDEPVAEVIDEPVAEVIDEPVAEVIDEPVAEVIDEPVAEVIDEPVAEVIDEPVAATIAALSLAGDDGAGDDGAGDDGAGDDGAGDDGAGDDGAGDDGAGDDGAGDDGAGDDGAGDDGAGDDGAGDDGAGGWKRGIIAVILCLTPILVFPWFWEPPLRYILLGIISVLILTVSTYFVGRYRSLRLPPFYPRKKLNSAGENILGNRAIATGLGALILASFIILLPDNLGLNDKSQGQKAPPIKDITNEVNRVKVFMGWYATIDGVTYWMTENKKQSTLDVLNKQVRKPPKGYRWVLYYFLVDVKKEESEFFASNMAIRLIDDKGRVYLPDYGAGAINTERGFIRVEEFKGMHAYWTPAYLVPINRKPERVEVVPFQGTDKIFDFVYPTPADTKRLQAEAKLNDQKKPTVPGEAQKEKPAS